MERRRHGATARGEAAPLTARGAATRLRILEAAAGLVHAGTAESVSLDAVMAASGASKSQLYHYFADKNALVREVIDYQAGRIVKASGMHFDSLDSLAGLRQWRDAVLAANRAGGFRGCPLGSLVDAGTADPAARLLLDGGFAAWGAVIASGLARMQRAGRLAPSVDVAALALGMLAAVQGGLLLAKAANSEGPLKAALDLALGHAAFHAGAD